jgi:hypothetical protein
MTQEYAKPTLAPYVRNVEGMTQIMIPIGPHEAVNEVSAITLGFAQVGRTTLQGRLEAGSGYQPTNTEEQVTPSIENNDENATLEMRIANDVQFSERFGSYANQREPFQ